MSDLNNLREQFLQQGAKLVQYEISEQAEFAVQVQQDQELKNIDLLSESLIVNRNLPKNIKAKTQEYQTNLQRILLATASFIEKEKFKSVDDAISNINLGKIDKNKLTNLVNAQKKLSFSYGTLVAVIEIFKLANKLILSEINDFGATENSQRKLGKAALYLKNAIIVYELTSFIVDYLSDFNLQGIDDLKYIKDEIFKDIENNKKNDESLKLKAINKGSDSIRESTLRDIEQRDGVRNRIKEKWESMLKTIDGQSTKVKEAKNYIGDLELVRENAKNRIDILNITATTLLVEDSLNRISELASTIQDWALPPLDERAACELLGLEL
jgi:hypothetical protein